MRHVAETSQGHGGGWPQTGSGIPRRLGPASPRRWSTGPTPAGYGAGYQTMSPSDGYPYDCRPSDILLNSRVSPWTAPAGHQPGPAIASLACACAGIIPFLLACPPARHHLRLRRSESTRRNAAARRRLLHWPWRRAGRGLRRRNRTLSLVVVLIAIFDPSRSRSHGAGGARRNFFSRAHIELCEKALRGTRCKGLTYGVQPEPWMLPY